MKIKYPALTVITGTLFFGFIIAYMITIFFPPPEETEEQLRNRELIQQEGQQIIEERKRISEAQDEFCLASYVCYRYSDARQNCATAGDFNNCIKVKMEKLKIHYYLGWCNNDGAVDPSLFGLKRPANCSLTNAMRGLW